MNINDLNVVITTEKLKPSEEYFGEKDLFYPKTNERIITTFTVEDKIEEESDFGFLLSYIRGNIFKTQTRLPMKYLKPIEGIYLSNKTPLKGKSNNIRAAAKIIEPTNIGFNEYIKYILINQQIPIGTIFTIHCTVPYESTTRYFIHSGHLKCNSDIKLDKPLFDPYVHIGTLDIGSEYTAKFEVDNVNLDLYDSFSLFNFKINDGDKFSFSIINYDFVTDIEYILNSMLEQKFEKYEKETKDFLKLLIEKIKK